jgi:hypothetical protein
MKKQGRPKVNEITERRQVIIQSKKLKKKLAKDEEIVHNVSLIINKRLLHSYEVTPNFNDL